MKAERQKHILKIVSEHSIETQDELTKILAEANYKITQATISRDIKELGLIKIPVGNNRHKYALTQGGEQQNVVPRLERMFNDAVIKIDSTENLIVLKTLPGTAHAVASCIDHLDWSEILGSLAGDDTVLVVASYKDKVALLKEKIKTLFI